jgi:hypothetical protein
MKSRPDDGLLEHVIVNCMQAQANTNFLNEENNGHVKCLSSWMTSHTDIACPLPESGCVPKTGDESPCGANGKFHRWTIVLSMHIGYRHGGAGNHPRLFHIGRGGHLLEHVQIRPYWRSPLTQKSTYSTLLTAAWASVNPVRVSTNLVDPITDTVINVTTISTRPSILWKLLGMR